MVVRCANTFSSLAEPVHAEVAIVDVDSKTAAILRRNAQRPGEYSGPMPIRLSCTGQVLRVNAHGTRFGVAAAITSHSIKSSLS
jgi:hypothetical protein